MSKASDDVLPSIDWVSLRQAALWAGPRLRPLEWRFEELKNYPQRIQVQAGIANGIEFEFEALIEQGKLDVAEALMQGNLPAEGRKGIVSSGSRLLEYDDAELDPPTTYTCQEHEIDFSSIPPRFWQIKAIQWDESAIRQHRWHEDSDPIVDEYIKVRILTRNLLRTFPDDSTRSTKPERARAHPGRPPKYNQQTFFVLCALEADANSLRTRKSEFHSRMAELWSVVLGEPVPERNWFSERFDEIENMRAAFERGRQSLDGK